jgi:hypothetical protein
MQQAPIDMEIINHGCVTGLFGHEESALPVELQAEHELLINEFNKAQNGRVFRNTPVATHIFTALLSCFKMSVNIEERREFVTQARDAILATFKRIPGCEVLIRDDFLDSCLFKDFINDDVPILCQRGVTVYYGSKADDKYKIASLLNREGI